MATIKLDCKNLMCPRPIVELSKAIQAMKIGDILEMEATDPAFEPDLRAWAKQTGNELLSLDSGNPIKATIKKNS